MTLARLDEFNCEERMLERREGNDTKYVLIISLSHSFRYHETYRI
jgi:hypothetical protein